MTEHDDATPSSERSTPTTPPTEPHEAGTGDPTPATASPGSELAVVHGGTLDARIRYAREIAAAGTLLPKAVRDGLRPSDAQQIAGRVFLIAETGNMLGVHPIAALQGVHVIEGKPTLSPALMGALVRRAGHRFRVGTTGKVTDGTITARATVTRSDDPEPFVAEWDLPRAERAGLITLERGPNGVKIKGKQVWQNYPEAMLKARATSEVCREAAEDVLMGVHYTPEELGAIVDGEGGVVEATLVHEEPVAPAEPSPQDIARDIAARAAACTSKAALTQLWQQSQRVVASHSWASDYTGLKAYAEAMTVEHGGATMTLLERLNARAAEVGDDDPGQGGGGQPPVPAAPPQPSAPTEADPEGIVDAEVVEDAPAPLTSGRGPLPADEDPWASPTVDSGPDGPQVGHDAAVGTVAAQLGGEVVETDPAELQAHTTRVAEHAARQAERDDAAAEQGRRVVEPTGAGRAAFEQAKAEAKTAAERSRAEREAAASARRRTSTRSDEA